MADVSYECLYRCFFELKKCFHTSRLTRRAWRSEVRNIIIGILELLLSVKHLWTGHLDVLESTSFQKVVQPRELEKGNLVLRYTGLHTVDAIVLLVGIQMVQDMDQHVSETVAEPCYCTVQWCYRCCGRQTGSFSCCTCTCSCMLLSSTESICLFTLLASVYSPVNPMIANVESTVWISTWCWKVGVVNSLSEFYFFYYLFYYPCWF